MGKLRAWYILGFKDEDLNRTYNEYRAEQWAAQSEDHYAIAITGSGKTFYVKEIK
jgi:hypothetical protein